LVEARQTTQPSDSSGGNPTIFEYAGGPRALLKLTEAFYTKVKADPLLEPVFKDFTHEHVTRVALWLGEVFRGPEAYTEQRGGHLTILGAHAGRHITKAQRDRWVELMLETAREVLPANEIFQERFRSYIEFGADIALRASQMDEAPKTAGAIPKWDWEPGATPDW
jgi:hemoglobin